jgi:hypothetical protein
VIANTDVKIIYVDNRLVSDSSGRYILQRFRYKESQLYELAQLINMEGRSFNHVKPVREIKSPI